MGNKHCKWCPEVTLRKWTCRKDDKYTHLSAHRARRGSRKVSRKCAFLETIEEEWLISDDHTSVPNGQELLLPQDTKTHPVAQMSPGTVQAPEVTQPAALVDPKPNEAQAKMKNIQEAEFDGQEQPNPVTASHPEEPMLSNGSAPGKRQNSTEERVLYCSYDRAESANHPEEADAVTVADWNAGYLTPEEAAAITELEGYLFEYKEIATKEEILAPADHGRDGLHREDEVLQSRDVKETDCLQETTEE